MIDELIGQAVAQHVLAEPASVDSLFAEGTHELVG